MKILKLIGVKKERMMMIAKGKKAVEGTTLKLMKYLYKT
jgi:hypothetical protein